MREREWRRTAGALMLTAALTVAGCADGGSESAAHERSPLDEFFGWEDAGPGGYEFTEEERQWHHEIQEYIASCMAEQGFVYHPEPFWGDGAVVGPPADDPYQEAWALQEEDPKAFAEQYGYAITTVDIGSLEDPSLEDPEWHASEHPNHRYRDSLSPAARQEYERALGGELEEQWDGEGVTITHDLSEDGGCHNEAYQQAHGMGEGWAEERARFAPLWDEWGALHQRIRNDPRLFEAMQGWRSCMAEAGHPGLHELRDGHELVYQRQSEVYRWGQQEVPQFDDPVEEMAYRESLEPYEPGPEEMAELRAFELELAWADYTCRTEQDVDAVERQVRFALEAQFIEDHRPLLEEYRHFLHQHPTGR